MAGIQLLAVDFGTIVTLFFVAISVIGAVLNASNSNKDKNNKGGNRPRPRDSSVRREIEEFLEQQGGRKPKAEKPMILSEDDLEIVDEPVRRSVKPKAVPSGQPRQTKRPAAQPSARATKPPAPARPKTLTPSSPLPASSRSVGHQDLGDGLRKHVQSAMSERVAAQAQKDLPHLATAGQQAAAVTDRQLQANLDAFKVTGKSDPSNSQASPLLKMLRNPGSVRNAVLLAEIMTPPRALRK
ncbi:MAG: hypothetical protein DWH91_11295 [Planctomycetota bacterium]|nr:MAG: hypothetical protein DWH91_11295 [Planctomycetota bacterium]